jgi:hypothetical protein
MVSYNGVNMERAAIILLYVGAILIGSQYVGKMGYIQTIINLSFARTLPPVINKLMRTPTKKNKFKQRTEKAGLVITLILLFILLTVATIVLSPFLLIELFIGRPLMWVNFRLNRLLLKLMEPWKEIYFTGVRAVIKGQRTRIKPTDKNLWAIAEENKVPFLALIGVVCVTAGFILQLVG